MSEERDRFFAPRTCLRDPIDEIWMAAAFLNEAVDAHLAGNVSEADRLIREADMPAIAVWTDSIWGAANPDILRRRAVPGAPPFRRIGARMPSAAAQRAAIQRDGFYCRFCGIPVVATPTRARIACAYPDALRWGSRNAEQHAAFQCMWLQFDHIVPHARGGDSGLSNIVITCAPCNYGRANWTLEEVGLLDPRAAEPPPRPMAWDGLERFLR